MSIKTPGASESNTFKTTNADASVPGFMTNDATGLFEYGVLGPAVGTPVGASMWDFIEEQPIPVSTTSITFSGLNGDDDKVYKIVAHLNRARAAIGTSPLWRIRPNGIFSSVTQQTTQFRMRTSNIEQVFTHPGLVMFAPNDGIIVLTTYFYAESGKIRTMRSRAPFKFFDSGAFGPQARGFDNFFSGFWNDSTTVVTSLLLDNDTAPPLAGNASTEWRPGDRIKLYKLNR